MNFAIKTLIVAAHPDDEVLGCGGLMARISEEGGVVEVLFLSEGESSRFPKNIIDSLEVNELIDMRRQAGRIASSILGAIPPKFINYPDNRLDSVDLLDLVKVIEDEIQLFQPSRIITHFPGDLNIDHSRVSEAVLCATRPFGPIQISEVLFFEIPSSTEWRFSGAKQSFVPNLFIDIEQQMNRKFEALAAYGSELREFPHPRSLEAIGALMRWRGSIVGFHAAESFMISRMIK